jgi:RNA-directed DNA polymerase
MRRAGQLFERIAERENLRAAVAKAMIGKRSRPDAAEFASDLEENLQRLRLALLSGTMELGVARQFIIHDPKERTITAPCFRERVLHHAIMNVCERAFERFLIHDTFACRRGKGREAAVLRARHFARRHECFLKMDVRKYFESVPHDVLLAKLRRRFKDARLLDLFARILAAHRGGEGRGLPIGALTSQHLANFYLGYLDRFVKESLHVRGYVRYMDDFVLWADWPGTLHDARLAIGRFLRRKLWLEPKHAGYISDTQRGMDFLGCRVYPDRVTLNRRSRRRFENKLQALEGAHAAGEMNERELQQRATSLVAFTKTAGVASWQFRRRTLERLPVGGHGPRTA